MPSEPPKEHDVNENGVSKTRQDPTYSVKSVSTDGRVFEVAIKLQGGTGKSNTMAAISSRFAYYNAGRKTADC